MGAVLECDENKMKKENWTKIVDIITVVWISVFFLGFIVKDEGINQICNQFNFFLLPVFLLDLYPPQSVNSSSVNLTSRRM